jgi:hypothetical protein
MCSVKEIIEHLTEGDDDFSVKDAMPEATPEFQFRVVDFKVPTSLNVFVDGKWIGIVGKVSWQEIGGKRFLLPTTEKNPYVPEMWTANALPEMSEHPAQETFKSAQEAAQWLWDHRQFSSVWKMESEVVSQVIDSDEGVTTPAPVKLAATELMDAGFSVTKAEEHEKGWLLECNWLAPSNTTFIAGAQRVKEVVGKHLKESLVTTRRNGQKMELIIRSRT